MKINSIRFKNLNSIKGEWNINFDDSDFQDNGLFAITGKTGSGKTTILDAISLALYHQTPRLGKITASSNDLMTRHTGECSAEVEFTSNGIRYRSSWQQTRAKTKADGKLQPPKVELANADTDEIIENKASKKLEKVEALTGLNFERFTRSVMLAQGAFTAFLKAEEKLKASMLEEITGTEIYTLISKTIFDSEREEKNKLLLLKSKADGAKLLSPEEIELLNQHLKISIDEFKQFDKNATDLSQVIVWLETIEKYKREQIEFTEAKKTAEEKFNAFRPELKKLTQYLPAIKLNDKYKKRVQLEQDKVLILKELGNLDGEVKKSTSLFNEIEPKLEKATQRFNEFVVEKEKTEVLINQTIVPLDQKISVMKDDQSKQEQDSQEKTSKLTKTESELKTLRNTVDKDKSNLTNKTVWLDEHSAHATLNQKLALISSQLIDAHQKNQEISLAEREGEQLTKQLTTTSSAVDKEGRVLQEESLKLEDKDKELVLKKEQYTTKLAGKEIEEIRQQQIDALAYMTELQTLKSESEKLVGNESKLTELTKEIETLAATLSRNEVLLEKEQVQQGHTRELLATHQILLEKEQQIKNLSDYRDKLSEGEDCPLCGSSSHPAIENYKALDLSTTETKLKELTVKLTKVDQSVNNKRLQVATDQATVKSLSSQKAQQIDALSQSKADWSSLAKKLECKLIYSDQVELIKLLTFQSEKATKLKKLLVELTSLKQSVDSLGMEVNKMTTDLQQKKNTLELATQQLASDKKQLAEKEIKCKQRAKELAKFKKNLTQELSEFDLNLDLELAPATNISILEEVNKTFVQVKTEVERLTQKIMLSEKDLGLLVKNLDIQTSESEKTKEALALLNQELDIQVKLRLKLFGDKEIQIVRQELVERLNGFEKDKKQLQESLNGQQSIVVALKSKLGVVIEGQAHLDLILGEATKLFQEALADSVFENEADFKAALIDEVVYKELDGRKERLDKALTTSLAQLSQVTKKLKTEVDRELTTQPLEEARDEHVEIRAKREERQKVMTETRLKLTSNADAKKGLAELLGNIDLQEKEHRLWMELSSLIGSATGDKFSRFAQSITMNYLIQLANKHLSNLFNRYQLKGGENLGLLVIDSYQADIERPVETLSGGESFLISLSLALGLSDLASDKVNIESLFLDEGFGTLDGETLDMALDTLDGLNASGKMIGVISHVEALKERIPMQINIQSSGGISKLDDRYLVVK